MCLESLNEQSAKSTNKRLSKSPNLKIKAANGQ